MEGFPSVFTDGGAYGEGHPRGVGEGGRMVDWVALRVGGGMGSRIRLHEGRLSVGGQGWVPAYARTTDGGEGGRMVDWVALRVGGGMGFRIRLHEGRLSVGGQGWVPAYARTRERGGFPHSSRGRALGGRTRGWVHRHPRTTGWEREEG